MPDQRLSLDLADAIELSEMLTFLGDWLAGRDTELLARSLNRVVGHDIDNLVSLQTDLAHFVLLLNGDNGDRLFGGNDRQR